MIAARAVKEESAESVLVRDAVSGNRAAFGRLYERHARAIHGILLTYVSHGDAEDLLHDVFITAMQRLPDLREPNAFPGWLAAIARNRAHEFHRRRKLEPADVLERLPGNEIRPEAFEVLSKIRKLPECYAETLVLRFVEGMTGPEIAERTGLTAESVRVNLCRGMKLLRELIAGPRAGL